VSNPTWFLEPLQQHLTRDEAKRFTIGNTVHGRMRDGTTSKIEGIVAEADVSTIKVLWDDGREPRRRERFGSSRMMSSTILTAVTRG
jgi:hypothetical protein